MENKSNKSNAGEAGDLQQNNPVDKRFREADDADFGADSTTGSGFSEAEREVHDGASPQKPASPQKD